MGLLTQQYQKFRQHDPENGMFGDCHRTCMAMLLGCDRDKIPNFGEHYLDMEKWDEMLNGFLDSLGLFEVNIAFKFDEGTTFDEARTHFVYIARNQPFLMGGTSINGTNHSIAIDCDGKVFDPQGRSPALIGPSSDGHYWFTVYAVKPGTIVVPWTLPNWKEAQDVPE